MRVSRVKYLTVISACIVTSHSNPLVCPMRPEEIAAERLATATQVCQCGLAEAKLRATRSRDNRSKHSGMHLGNWYHIIVVAADALKRQLSPCHVLGSDGYTAQVASKFVCCTASWNLRTAVQARSSRRRSILHTASRLPFHTHSAL